MTVTHCRSLVFSLCALPLVTAAPPLSAQYLSGCPVPPESFWPELRSLPPDVVDIEAESVETVRFESVHARGGVRLFGEGRRLESEWIDFYPETRRVETQGRSRVFDGDLLVEAGEGWYQLDEGVGEFADVEYWLRSRTARGGADKAEQEGSGRIRLTGATFTTCPEGNDDWWLSGSDIRLNQETGRGDARNVVLRFKDVPVFYTPYVQFPIDDRRMTGLLMPTAAYSKRHGAEIAVPWYWNIAPNYDATLTPHYFDKRGLMLDTEWRYLRPSFDGVVDLRYLPDDDLAGEDRHLVHWRQRARPISNLRFDIDATDVSDPRYFRDFGADLFSTSPSFAPRRATAVYDQQNWRLTGRVEDFQTLDPNLPVTSKPYQRLPQVLLAGTRSLYPGLDLELRSEVVHFARKDTVAGNRFDLYPAARYRWDQEAYFVESRAGLRYTAYDLKDVDPGAESSPTRTVPDLTLDGGLFFERLLDSGMVQTLEPRLFYAYVPFRNQDAIPVFDTRNRDFSFGSLFFPQRFTGTDRVGDTNQVTAALTSRIVDPETGRERLNLTAGQIYYLEDRLVRLNPSSPPLTSSTSDLVAGARAVLGYNWEAEGSIFYDPDANETSLATLALSYRPDERALMNLGYRLRRDRLEQTDISALWPLNQRWTAIGRWNYSLFDDQHLEILGGLEYRSCCYGMRIGARRFLKDSGDYDNAIYFQITFNGLTRFDTGLDDLLREGIAGYDTFDTR
jgi:LPS-assembly protein